MAVDGVVPIAVIGVGCRFPGGVDSPGSLWRLLLEGRETVGPVPPDRWDAVELMSFQDPATAARYGRGSFLDGDLWAWEPTAFAVAPREAPMVDPQHQLAAECAWEAIEHAGVPLRRMRGSATGVYLGLFAQDHMMATARPVRDRLDGHGAILTVPGFAPGRIGFALDLRGPTVAVETLCSSGLTAVHLACQALAAGDCEMALAGGTQTISGPHTLHWEAETFHSDAGHCFAFDARADGFVRGEGAGMVLLKPLSRALADGDRVLAVIRGSAMSNDGQAERLTAPSSAMQETAFRKAVERAGIDPGTVGLVEAHGPGTPTGDSAEYASLNAVYGRGRGRCALGSLKSNLGHLEAAAGIAGLIKAVWAVREGVVPPNVNFASWNPAIDVDPASRLFVPVRAMPWPVEGTGRLAAVSSYGLSGTNTHVVVEQAPAPATRRRGAGARNTEANEVREAGAGRLFLLSAPSRQALPAAAERLASWVESATADLGDLAHTLAVRRSHTGTRLVVHATTRTELTDRLRAFAAHGANDHVTEGRPVLPPAGLGPVLVFSGQGSESFGMCHQLLGHDRAFTAVVDETEPMLREIAGFSLRRVLTEPGLLTDVEHIHPTLVAVQLALVALWRSWGIEPAAVIGQSVGEITAAVVAGALSVRQGLTVSHRRAVVAGRTTGGVMASVMLNADDARAAIEDLGLDDVWVAVMTSPGTSVVAGSAEQVERLVAHWQSHDVGARMVQAGWASHTPHMDPVLDDIRALLADITPQQPALPLYSTAHQDPRTPAGCDARYWALNLREPVRLHAAFTAALQDGHRLFVECSPHPLITRAIADTAAHDRIRGVVALGTLRRDTDDRAAIAANLAAAHCAGAALDWEHRYPGELVDAPTTTWHRVHYRPEPAHEPVAPGLPGATQHSLLGGHVHDPDRPGRHLWQTHLSPTRIPWLADHQVADAVVMAGAGMCEMVLSAARQALATDLVTITGLTLHTPLLLDADPLVTTRATVEAGGRLTVDIVSAATPAPPVHARARVSPGAVARTTGAQPRTRAENWTEIAPDDIYRTYRTDHDVHHGPAFQGLQHLQVSPEGDQALATVRIPGTARTSAWMTALHPVLLDTLAQAGGAVWLRRRTVEPGPLALAGLDTLRLLGPTNQTRTLHLRLTEATSLHCVMSATFTGQGGQPLAEVEGLRIASLTTPQERLRNRLAQAVHLPEPLPTDTPAASAGAWCVLADANTPWNRGLSDALTARGCDTYLRPYTLRTPLDARDVAPPDDGSWSGIVLALDNAEPCGPDPETSRLRSAALCELLRHASTRTPPPKVWAVIRHHQDGAHAGGPSGVIRTAAYEYPHVPTGLIEAGPHSAPETTAAELLAADTTIREVRLHPTGRTVARLHQHKAATRHTPPPLHPDPVPIRPDASYLVTGAFGGLGLLAAQWLARNGATHLVLFAHRPADSATEAALQQLRREGTDLTVITGDIGDTATANAAVAAAAPDRPLRGVLHTAATIEDATLDTLARATVERVWHAKATGAWNLHQATLGTDLDFFTLYSSAAALLGSPGQAAYAAANAYLDALASWRHTQALPAASVQWGAWARTGRGQHMGERGLPLIDPEDGLTALAHLLDTPPGATPIAYAPLDLDRWLGAFPTTAPTALLARTHPGTEQPDGTLLQQLADADHPDTRTVLMRQHIITTVQDLLHLHDTHLEPATSLVGLGLDSLTAMQLRQRLQRDLMVLIPPSVLWTKPNPADLADWLLDHLAPTGD
ncbi:type I polyketide synthase [Streptomyces sp. TLI_053]|uniref:type I polyketide synthase n=1 Tax=Streptomyces sp. TLI_053 TaxID=1855352 RepID=UPI000B836CB8|nr:type I polyketide synthase [Streptomyces sp. TLI_053]